MYPINKHKLNMSYSCSVGWIQNRVKSGFAFFKWSLVSHDIFLNPCRENVKQRGKRNKSVIPDLCSKIVSSHCCPCPSLCWASGRLQTSHLALHFSLLSLWTVLSVSQPIHYLLTVLTVSASMCVFAISIIVFLLYYSCTREGCDKLETH